MKTKRLSCLLVAAMLALSLFMVAACNKNDEPEHQPVYTVTVSEPSLDMQRYGREILTATVYADGEATSDAVEWTSSNTAVATVQGGTVSAVGAGEARITASAHGVSANCTVVVTDVGAVPALKTDVSEVSLSLAGGSVRVSAYVDFLDYDTADASISFQSENPAVATVSADGTVTPVAVGKTTLAVSASWNGYSGTGMTKYIPVTVNADIEVAMDAGTAETVYSWQGDVGEDSFGNTRTYTVEVYKNAEVLPSAQVTWRTSDEKIATIENGTLTAHAPGSVEVWCEYVEESITYSSVKRVVEVEYPYVDDSDGAAGVFVFKDMTDGQAAAAEVLSAFGIEMTAGNDLQAVYSEKVGSDSILQGGSVDFTAIPFGESTLSVAGANYGYIKSLILATDSFDTGSEFDAWQAGRAEGTGSNSNAYSYGEGEYYVLGDDITVTSPDRQVFATGGFGMAVSNSITKIGFVGTFNGMGHTITINNAGRAGIFGDLGEGSLVKNLKLVATLSADDVRPAALASIAKGGATIENCWFDVTAGSNSLAYNGLIFAGVGRVTMRNCVVVGTPGSEGGQKSGLLSAYTHPDYTEGGAGDAQFTFENVVAVSKNAANLGWIWLESNAGIYDNGVTVLDGSETPVENLKLPDEFDTSGFDPEYFYKEDGYIPMWGGKASDFEPVLEIEADVTEISTESGANTANLTYELTERGAAVTPERVEWESNAPGIASVTQEGVVTGLREGTAEITLTATYGGAEYTATITITVTMPVEEITAASALLFDKSAENPLTAEQVFGADSDIAITEVYYNSLASQNIYDGGTLDVSAAAAGEGQVFFVVGNDHTAYRVTATVATQIFYKGSEFDAWQAGRTPGNGNRTAYSYGEGEYYVLGDDITVTSPTHEVFSSGSLGAAVSTTDTPTQIGFVGTFNGMGHTITVNDAGKAGIFGDLGAGSVVKNLKLVATLAASGNQLAALASVAKGGAIIENCWFEVKDGGSSGGYNGLLFSAVGSITMRNCVVVGTPGAAGNAGLLSAYTRPEYSEANQGDAQFTFENVVAVSKNAANLGWIWLENYTDIYDTGVTVLDGSSTPVENLKLPDDFNTSGFNSEYFYIEDGYIPMWGGAASDFTPVLEIEADDTEISTQEGANTVTLTYELSRRGAVVTPESVAWESDALGIATVTQDGVVTGIAEGEALITLTVTYQSQQYTDTVTINVTMPVEKTDVELLLDKSVANILEPEDVFGAETQLTIESVHFNAIASDSIFDAESGALDLSAVPVGEEKVFYVIGSDHVAYRVTAIVATQIFYKGSEFNTWQSNRTGGTNNTTAYYYGEGEYYALGADISLTGLDRGVFAAGGFGAAVSNSSTKIGFVGTFNGMGHTITVTNATKMGIFGDLGTGAYIKNLRLVATLSATAAKPAALASIAKGGAVIENCWFDVSDGGSEDGYNGLIFAGVGSVTMRNCVVVGTPGSAGNSGLLSAYTYPGYTEGGEGDAQFTFENVVAVSKSAANLGWIWLENNTDIYDTGVTVIDGSAGDFDITAYELTGFDASGFNTEYFTVTENRIPQWKSAAE